MVSPHANSHAHQHEWEARRDCALYYEDGAVHLEEECIYTEEKYVGERRGEAFYETMYECDARRMHRFDLVKVEEYVHTGCVQTEGFKTVAEGFEEVQSLYDAHPSLAEGTELRAEERLCGEGELFEHISLYSGPKGESFSIAVHHDGNTYLLHYEWTDVKRA